MEDAAKRTDHSEMTKDVVPENHCCRKLENSMQAVQDTKLQETTEVTASEDKQNNLVIPLQYKKPTEKRFVRKKCCNIPFLRWNLLI